MKYRVYICYSNWMTEEKEYLFHNKTAALEYGKLQVARPDVRFVTVLHYNGKFWTSIKFLS